MCAATYIINALIISSIIFLDTPSICFYFCLAVCGTFERFVFKFERLLSTSNAINSKVGFRYVLRVDLRNDRG